TQSVVSSFNRTAGGGISLGTIDVDITKVSLFDASATGAGLLQKGQALTAATAGNIANVTNSSNSAAATITLGTFAAFTLDDNDTMQFQLAVNGDDAKTITIDKATVDAALGSTNGKVATDADMETVMVAALKNAGIDAVDHTGTPTASQVKVDGSGTNLTITTGLVGTATTAASLTTTGAATSNNGNFYNVMDIDITNASADDLNNYLGAVDKMFQNVTSAASDLGAVQSRITSQQTFVKALMDSIDSGVGSLVDADMNEASTRLKALQTQQQLGIQALSIANSNSQNILSLFR
ncbi:MAG TPA: flagellin, partial [Rhizobiaceae bacterium]|nr:flagellin [Rhizobiaceae bacterium]